jgi:FKBP-type peptidyl-prolyl cis-trans isomerase FklB
MKKILFIAVALLCSAAFCPASADKKKDKKKKQAKVTAISKPVKLVTSRDSLSYAAGYAAVDGLIPFIQRQYQVDTTYMAQFVEGFKSAISKTNDPEFRAYGTGQIIADLFNSRILPGTASQYADTPDSLNAQLFTQAFIAAIERDTTFFNMASAQELARTRSQEIKEEKDAAYRISNTQWLVANREQEGVVTLPSGLQYKVITEGKGEKPTDKDRVTVKYEGRLIDGTVFDSSYQRDPQTTSFRVNQVIKGWTEALCLMPVGSKWELYIPQDLAYGARQQGQIIKPYSTLIFTVELVSIDKQ